MTGLSRDGHLTDLALEYVLDGTPLAGTETHLQTCEICAARLNAADAVDLPQLPGMVAEEFQTPRPANRPWMWGMVLAATALVVATAVVQSTSPEDGYRSKGVEVGLQVFRDEGERSQRLRNGDAVAVGDRIGFQVRNRHGGYLMVLGIDGKGETYLCYPQADGLAAAVEAAPMTPLSDAVRMDDTTGTERLVAVLCPAPFDFDQASTALAGGAVPEGCAFDDVTLEKK